MNFFIFSIIIFLYFTSVFLFAHQQQQDQDKIIEILEYGDEFCTGEILVQSNAEAGKCYSGEYASGSGILNCIGTNNNKTISASSSVYRCLELHEFSDDRCSQRTSIRERVCSTCLGDKVGKHSEFICNENEIVYRSNCDGDFSLNANKTVCNNCTTNTIIPFRKCTKISSDRFALVTTEVTNCKNGVVQIQDFSNTRVCSKAAQMSEFLMPNNACEGGVKYVCQP
jgi:hypothetical protein